MPHEPRKTQYHYEEPSSSDAAEGTGPADRILVVDDEPVVRRLFQQILTAAQFDVVVATNGFEALELLRRDSSIGLVLLDLMMPEMDGWRFRHAQRADPRLAAIPVVVVTGAPIAPEIRSELQAVDYLRKPVGASELQAVAGTYCRPRQP